MQFCGLRNQHTLGDSTYSTSKRRSMNTILLIDVLAEKARAGERACEKRLAAA